MEKGHLNNPDTPHGGKINHRSCFFSTCLLLSIKKRGIKLRFSTCFSGGGISPFISFHPIIDIAFKLRIAKSALLNYTKVEN
ncbi:hypothetical protein J2Z70_006598 [Paenibacillus silagei]|uniref:Uncharacterized protein n=1 Tax=Paenibacillus silagei TaxID=1670801 RepID=A0ABS4P234_9BACL|nr:hypothetical protein [Paenibacillus silagei]